ncbi:TPA: hypothetical protein ACNOH4_003568, partial [Citrobacter koseri]
INLFTKDIKINKIKKISTTFAIPLPHFQLAVVANKHAQICQTVKSMYAPPVDLFCIRLKVQHN